MPGLARQQFTDDELTALALAADPGAPVDPDAVPLASFLEPDGDRLLPQWYMPSPMSFEQDNIKQVIINKRKLKLIEEMKQSVYGQAKESLSA